MEQRDGRGGGYNERENVEYIRRGDADNSEYDDFGRKRKSKTAGAAAAGTATSGASESGSAKPAAAAAAVARAEDGDGDDDDDDDDDDGGDDDRWKAWETVAAVDATAATAMMTGIAGP